MALNLSHPHAAAPDATPQHGAELVQSWCSIWQEQLGSNWAFFREELNWQSWAQFTPGRGIKKKKRNEKVYLICNETAENDFSTL